MRVRAHLKAIGLLPGVVTLVVPVAIVSITGAVSPGWGLAVPLSVVAVLLGGGFIALGLTLMYRTISLFATVGQGTLAPWNPTRKLVVQGPYRYLRHPMISGVLSILLGEAALLGSLPILIWFLVFLAGNAIYLPRVEERGLARRFGEDYLDYKRHVPRWIPRLKPWTPG